ncbi:helix-turn-helix transcriptional regulator [Clostridium estertheticum]|uniref:helix-turn-helix transcriptional regulator n=1 Tax=Clostridium estertheticum TaxID=238834 RepID=UPI00384B110A
MYTYKIVKNGLFVWGSKKAEVAGVKLFKLRVTIGLIESGKYNPSIKLCIAICKTLNKTLNDLFWEDESR